MGSARATRTAVATTLALTLAAGCGTHEDPDTRRRGVTGSTATGTTAGEEPAAAYAAWIDALAREDAAAACALQAPEFTIALRYDAILAGRAELGDPCTGFEAILWEDPAFDSMIVEIEVTQATEEDAILDVQGADGPQTVTMTYHRAAWRVLRTADRAEGDGAASRWLGAWCRLDPSMSREQIIALMGDPSGEYTVADGGEPQLWWAQDQYDFRAYLDPVDPDGPVLELVGDYDALSAEDRALLDCPELRS
jgi:hypothetical protein